MRQLSGVDALHVLEESPGAAHAHDQDRDRRCRGPTDRSRPMRSRQWARERLPQIPAMRWKVVKIPLGLGRPVFVDAGPFDVDRHLFVRAPCATGSDERARRARVADRERPARPRPAVVGADRSSKAWQPIASALVFKIHHAIMDGQASVRFFELAFDSDVPLTFGAAPERPEPVPSQTELMRFALRSQARALRPAAGRRPALGGLGSGQPGAQGRPAHRRGQPDVGSVHPVQHGCRGRAASTSTSPCRSRAITA